MELDLTRFAKSSSGPRNSHLSRIEVLPYCSHRYQIKKGPSLPALCSAMGMTVPRELADTFGLRAKLGGRFLVQMPIQLTLQGIKPRFGDGSFAVAVMLRSISLKPDLDSLHWSLFGKEINPRDTSFMFHDPLMFRGDLFLCDGTPSEIECTPQELFEVPRLREHTRACIAVYDSKSGVGWVGLESQEVQAPEAGVIKDLEVFFKVLRPKYIGGYIEYDAPDGMKRWGVLANPCDHYLEICSEKKGGAQWEYFTQKRPPNWNIQRVLLDEKERRWEMEGDAFLCADGTLLYSFHIPARRDLPRGWKSGYYAKRFYRHDSPAIPAHVREEHDRDMPAWYRDELEALRSKAK